MAQRLKFNKKTLKAIVANPWFIFLAAGLIGALFFVYFYGAYIINPTHVNWLLIDGDLKQHYVGWEFYRTTAWTFPIGTISELAYPYGVPVTYTDSIPLLAIPFKLIAGILPEHFQYFGLWGLLCYILQAGFAALIVSRWTKNIFIILLSSVIFILAPVMMMRTFTHTALASQWIILAAIWFCLSWRTFDSVKRQAIGWTILLVIATLVHPYFLPMIGLFFATSLILTHKNWKSTLMKASIPFVATLSVFWIIGGFAIKGVAGGGLGTYALNLNSLINPFGWSSFIMTLPTNSAGTFENLNYLGFGVILLLPLALYLVIQHIWPSLSVKRIKEYFDIKKILIVLLFVGAIIFALSPQLQLGPKVLLDVPLPDFIEKIWSTFRATGRIFWPIYYLIIFGILAAIIYFTRKRKSQYWLVGFLVIFVTIQCFDIRYSAQASAKHAQFKSISSEAYTPGFNLEQWGKSAEEKTHLFILDTDMVEFTKNEDLFTALRFTDVARKYNLTMNTGYYARSPSEKILALQNEKKEALLSGVIDSSTLFVSRDEAFLAKLEATGKFVFEEQDGYTIIKQKAE